MGKDYDDDIGSKHEGCASMCIVIAIIFSMVVLLLSLCSCKTQYKVVEVPKVVTQTNVEHRTNIVRDTLLRRDSVIIVQRGDTVYHETWHHLQAINRTYIADTVRDTIPKIVTVTKTEIKEVEKKLSKWQRTKMKLGGWLLAAVAVLLLGGAVYGILKLKKIVK
ncbi:hypothetical protein [Sodaliphilus pleomorphus]|uniref:Uncharacterized protein n=1 Tax=Sodaliphilus pleomorphus TaxID=2606626 RepID=A0A6L5X952_9BACT|nr:hypothetical protein [Sodaliphilus pleomorphus]MSS16771.1 hypothetical protein [Sodaliphilus pleomorphus]